VWFKNKGARVIAGVKFNLIYINKFGESSDPVTLYDDQKLEINASRLRFFKNMFHPRQGVSVFVEKVAFVDGEIWSDHGSHSCSWKTPEDKILNR